MKTYEMKATEENLLTTFLQDSIARDADIIRFVKILDAIEDNYSIALDGNWGSGKTFFVKQTKMLLDAYNAVVSMDSSTKNQITAKCEKIDKTIALQPQVCIYYDAWENDNDDDPILSLVYSIVQSLNVDFTLDKDIHFTKIAASIMELFTGKDWNQLIDSFKSNDPLQKVKDSKNAEKLIKDFLDNLLSERGNRLVVLIDELDRCKPSYAVRLLERIKHYFVSDNITFVFSVNANELQHTIKRYYGDDFDACRYLDRFFDLRISLPPVDLQRYYNFLHFNNTHYTYDMVCDGVIKAFHFEMREISRYIQLSRIAAYKPTHSTGGHVFPSERGTEFCLLFIVPIMIGLKITDSQKYIDFITGKDGSPLIEVASCCGFYTRFYDQLLSSKESFDDVAGKTTVTIEQKLKELYNVLFGMTNADNDSKLYETVIGQYSFNQDTKNTLIRTVSLLSKYTSTEFV